MSENGVHVHSFKNTVVPPNCKENGYTLHKCDCGYEYKDSFVPCGNHNFELLEEQAATCTQNGVRKIRCSVCGEEKIFSILPLGHAWGAWSVQTVAKCTEDGSQIRVCSRCGTTEQQTINAIGHNFSKPKKRKDQKGMVEFFCQNCGETVIMQSKVRRALKKALLFVVLPLIIVVALVFSSIKFGLPAYHYSAAKRLIEKEDYTAAYFHALKSVNLKSGKELVDDFVIQYGNREYRYYDPKTDEEMATSHKYEYDKNGNKTLEIYYDNEENIEHKYVYEYDKNNNKTLEIKYNENDEVEHEYKYEYEYDKKGNKTLEIYYEYIKPVEEVDCEDDAYEYGDYDYYDDDKEVIIEYEYVYEDGDSDKSDSIYEDGDSDKSDSIYEDVNKCPSYKHKYVYEYDKNGNKTLEIKYDKEEKVEYKRIFEYDKNGNTALVKSYDGNGNLNSKTVYEYDKNGNETLYAKYDGDGDVVYKYKYEYDKNGNKTLEIYYDKNVMEYKYDYKYDKNDNLILSTTYDKDGIIVNEHEYEYDKNGNKTFESYYGKASEYDYECSYKYDENGNLIFAEMDGKEKEEIVLEYDRYQQLILREDYINGDLFYEEKYTYNYKKGTYVSETTRYDEDNDVSRSYKVTYTNLKAFYKPSDKEIEYYDPRVEFSYYFQKYGY